MASAFEKFKVAEIDSKDQSAVVGGITGGTNSTNEGCTEGDVGCCDADTRIWWDTDAVYTTTSRGTQILVKRSEIISDTTYLGDYL